MRIRLGILNFPGLLDSPAQITYNIVTGRSKKLEQLSDTGKESQPLIIEIQGEGVELEPEGNQSSFPDEMKTVY